MSKDILIQLLQDINRENVRFGTVEVSFTFHDGRPISYELTTHRRRNIDSLKKWLSKANTNYKGRVSSVKETGADEVTDEMLENLPF